MNRMFRDATAFNQDLSAWDVSRVTNMDYMFYSATAFNQTLCGKAWVESTAPQNNMFEDSLGGSISATCPG